MNTVINAVKFKADPKLENFVTEKVAKLDKMVDNATKCEVTLKVDKPESENNKVAEISISLPKQTLFNSKQIGYCHLYRHRRVGGIHLLRHRFCDGATCPGLLGVLSGKLAIERGC